ncbi:MAG: NUDIX hydrolase [Thermomicrobiales bacterium]
MTKLTRDFTIAVFVVHNGHLILHIHQKLQRWLPPGGHIEPNELPDDAAIREVLEETGIAIDLVGPRAPIADYPGQPRQLVRPEGIQLETIGQGHEHIDLVYFARPQGLAPDASLPALLSGVCWVSASELSSLELTDEIRDWSALAFTAMAQ